MDHIYYLNVVHLVIHSFIYSIMQSDRRILLNESYNKERKDYAV